VDEKKKKNIILSVIFALIVVGLVLAVSQTRIFYRGRAEEKKDPYLQSSYLLASPLAVQANGEEKIKISAFVLNEEGRGVVGKEMIIVADPVLEIKPIQTQTDKFGQAIFEVSSFNPGRHTLSASVDGQPFPQTVTITFR